MSSRTSLSLTEPDASAVTYCTSSTAQCTFTSLRYTTLHSLAYSYLNRAAVGTEFQSPYPWGSPYPRKSPGLSWGRNFNPHTHGDPHIHGRVQGCRGDGISIPIPIPMGIAISTEESRAAVGTEFLSPYPPHTHTNGDPTPTADLAYKRYKSVFSILRRLLT